MTKKEYQDMEVVGKVTARELEITGGGTLGEELKAAIKNYVDSVRYEVDGECYYFSDNPTSPAAKYGGAWEKIEGRVLLGASTDYPVGSTGGSATHSHSEGTLAAAAYIVGGGKLFMKSKTITPYTSTLQVTGSYSDNDSTSYETGTAVFGKTDLTSALSPYYATYIWHKISD